MASIRKRNGKWQAQVRKQGCKPVSKSFYLKEDALAWARVQEIAIDRGDIRGGTVSIAGITLVDLLQKYLDEVTPRKRGAENEVICLNAFMKFDIAKKKLSDITPADFGSFRDERLKGVKGSTFNRQIGRVQNAYEVAIREWNWEIRENPIKRIRKPRNEPSRERRLSEGEREKLMEALGKTRNKLIKPIVLLAIETGMRQGEILNAVWSNYKGEQRLLFIPVTKNGHPRTIPLSSAAVRILNDQKKMEGEDRIFPTSKESVKRAWLRLTKRAGVEDLHFHDLRHEAVSSFFEKGLSVPEVAIISGHKDFRMLARYTHLKAEDIVAKLN